MKRRAAALLLPPYGLLRLWSGTSRLSLKIVGTIAHLFLSLLYLAGIVFFLIEFTGLKIEWRGGYLPALTYGKTMPNYAAVESTRGKGAGRPASSSKQDQTNAYWTGFRGPLRNGDYQ